MTIKIGTELNIPNDWRSADIVLLYYDKESYEIAKDRYNLFLHLSNIMHISRIAKVLLTCN